MEALILMMNMGCMWYLCWRLVRGGDGDAADLGVLRYADLPLQ